MEITKGSWILSLKQIDGYERTGIGYSLEDH